MTLDFRGVHHLDLRHSGCGYRGREFQLPFGHLKRRERCASTQGLILVSLILLVEGGVVVYGNYVGPSSPMYSKL